MALWNHFSTSPWLRRLAALLTLEMIMWAIYHEGSNALLSGKQSYQYFIFSSKSAAWSYLINVVKPKNIDDFDVIPIRWSKA